LWEEQSLSSLREIQADVSGRIRTLRAEYARLQEQLTAASAADRKRALGEVYATVMRPAVAKLERLFKDILREPQTKHEAWFQSTYRRALEDALAQFRNPADPEDAESAFMPFREICRELMRYLKRPSLKLDMVSPALARLSSSGIPVPGLQIDGADASGSSSSTTTVTIQSIQNQVSVLPTKTKPKKLVLVGSDGIRYPYLLKGREDLHLDERIMQFLTIVNQLLSRHKQTRSRQLHARHYAVIPTGASSGLIQWVDNTTPLYAVFSEWQKRNSSPSAGGDAPKQASAVTTAEAVTPPNTALAGKQKLLRPIDQFYAKLIPALKAVGVSNVMNRSEWPQDVLRRVFLDLERDTPRDLLDRELWCASTSTADWWDRLTRYSRSVAVMSMIGYVIGLGDRHLDNILIDFSRGEVVHIDYNVCFEKGTKLRVPEVVPFRLTQNMHRALGVTVRAAYQPPLSLNHSLTGQFFCRVLKDPSE
jgi:PI-3-kinase-related kinase SMG-1